MKKKISLLLVALGGLGICPELSGVTSRVGSAEDLGMGMEFGQPIGVTAKYWLNSTLAIDAAMGYHFNGNFDLHTDALWHSFSSFHLSSGRLPFYAGLGGRVLLGNDSQLGARLPLGLSYLPSTKPIELFLEIAPVLELVPSVEMDVDGLVGFRVYINYLK